MKAALLTPFAFVLAFACATARADFYGEVIGLADGDTITVLRDRQQVKVRLAQIDAPEKAQAFGNRARQALADMVFRKQVFVQELGQDQYRRTLGNVWQDRLNVNYAMVSTGYAWAYRQYVTDPALLQIEAEARRQKLGLWAEPQPVEPWNFRRLKRKGSYESSQ